MEKNGANLLNNSDDDFVLPLEEQLENANSQIKDLQDYIKSKSLEDLKNTQLRQEQVQRAEKKLQEKLCNTELERDIAIERLNQL